jgi:hypothetical protein
MYTDKAIYNRSTVFNTETPAANANLLSTSFALSDNGTSRTKYLRVYACFSVAGKLTVLVTQAGATVTEILNGDTNLIAGAAYLFDIPISYGDTINFRYSAGSGTTLRFIVDEYSG